MYFRSLRFRAARRAWAAFTTITATGCLPGLTLTPQQAVAGKPSNVLVYFSADTNSGHPETGLRPEGLAIFENGTRVSSVEGRQTLLRPAAAHYTLYLLDLSGRILGAKEAGEIIKAASVLADAPDRSSNLTAVYSFDGSPELVSVVPFATQPDTTNAEPPPPRDRRRPVMGIESGVVAGLRTLNVALAADPNVLKAGTLVLFTDGTNRADRMRITDLHAVLGTPDNRKIDMVAVGVGSEVDEVRLEDLGRNGTILEADPARIRSAFDAAVAKVLAASKHYYLLSYCTPARAGLQDVRVETHAPDGLMGELAYTFNADGFTPGCDPTSPPMLVPPAPPPPPNEKPKDASEAKEPPPPPKKHHPSSPPKATPSRPTQAPAPPASDPFAP